MLCYAHQITSWTYCSKLLRRWICRQLMLLNFRNFGSSVQFSCELFGTIACFLSGLVTCFVRKKETKSEKGWNGCLTFIWVAGLKRTFHFDIFRVIVVDFLCYFILIDRPNFIRQLFMLKLYVNNLSWSKYLMISLCIL